jgi:cyclopropane-fatty-acyl-phospholipid synthase
MTATVHVPRDSGLSRLILSLGRRFIPPQIAGRIEIHLPSGRCLELGDRRMGATAELHLRNWNPLWRSMRRSSVGFCESYIAGEWESPAPEKVFSFYLRNRASFNRAGKVWMRRSKAVRLWHLLRNNSKRGSKRNIEAHYDLGNDFYRLWLDPTMSYSSGFFDNAGTDLEAAQLAKYHLVADALALEAGQDLLEIGCGWGGFARVAAERGANVLGITLSGEQLADARAMGAERMRFELMDYRDTAGQFDRIASIEMIEAVGEAHWPSYFKTISNRLAPGGIAVIQAITIDEDLFPAYRSRADFIQRHIFPGGMLPTAGIMRRQAEAAGLTFETVRRFGQDYAQTLRLWRERFAQVTPSLDALGFDAVFRRKWQLYFCYCEAGFTERVIDVGVYRLTKPSATAEPRAMPQSDGKDQ